MNPYREPRLHLERTTPRWGATLAVPLEPVRARVAWQPWVARAGAVVASVGLAVVVVRELGVVLAVVLVAVVDE